MINPITSTGTMGLPHFKNSRAAMELYEPVYTNLFTVDIQFPTTLGLTSQEQLLTIEKVVKISGLDTNKVPDAGAKQSYKFAERRFANAGPESTTIDVAFDFEVNLQGCEVGAPNMYAVKNLRKWSDLIYDPLTGRMGLKSQYVGDYIVITMHDKQLQPFWQWTLYNVWPKTSINPLELDYMNKSGIYKVTGYTFACDYWDERML